MSKRETRFKPDDKEQSKLFIEKAREIGADETASEADRLLGQMAKMKPQTRSPKRTRNGMSSARRQKESHSGE